MGFIDNLESEQVEKLLESGFRFKHRTLEEYIRLSGKPMQASEEYDWGEPVGREIWQMINVRHRYASSNNRLCIEIYTSGLEKNSLGFYYVL